MIFDKNRERIRALEKQLKGSGNPAKILAQLERLRKAGPEWWAAWYDSTGTKRREKPDKNTKQAAEQLERKRRYEVENGAFDCPDHRRVTVEQIVNYFLEYKNCTPDSRTLCKHITRHLGKITLDKIDLNPTILVTHFKNFPEKEWSPKYVWNYFIKLKAAIGFWVDMHRMHIVNPCIVVPKLVATLRPVSDVREVRPTVDDFNNLMVASVECHAPQALIDLFTAVRESGLRIGEVIKWRVQDFHLQVLRSENGEIVELPYFTSIILKRGRPVTQEMPMRRSLWELMIRVIGERREGPVWPWTWPPYGLIKRLGIMKQAGLTHLRPFHDYRKSFKTELKLQGATSDMSMYLQGHATKSMDEYYTQFRRIDAQCLFADQYRDIQSTNQ